MGLLKKIGAMVFALALLVGVVVAVSPAVKATGLHADLRATMLVSTDNGRTWQSGEPSICVRPGAELLVLYKIWNAGDLEVKSVSGYSTTTNGEYISANDIVNDDQDGDGHSFIFEDNADFTIANLESNGSENEGYQGIIVTANLTNDIPCDTNIEGSVTLTDFRTSTSSGREIVGFIGRALATDNRLALTSTFTLNVNADNCPKTCGAIVTTTTLPQTGSSILELVESLF